MLQRTRAPVISITRTGGSAAILTLIAPASPHARITAHVRATHGGWYHLGLRLGSRTASFLVSPGGFIKRG